ncbi:hypothetical protein WDW86_09140 [Bdellovibrionota bacterium FG-2]
MDQISHVSESLNLTALSHEELLGTTRKLAENERKISLKILHHLAEIDRRRAYAKLGHASLWDYVLKELKYSESAAYRRISAMRAIKEMPELEKKIESGTLSVSTVSQVQTFLKAERDQAHKKYSQAQKSALFEKCENKSSRDVTRELLTVSPLAIRVQKERLLTEDRTMISFVADTKLLGKMHRVRDLSVPRLQDPASYPELMDLMSEVTLDEIDPLRRDPKRRSKPDKPDKNVALITAQPTQLVGQSPSRAVSPSLRAQIWREFGGRCAYVAPDTGKRCDSTFGLEIEHCKPHALGGSSKDPANLKLLCRHHNQWQAIETYGLAKMEKYLDPKKG